MYVKIKYPPPSLYFKKTKKKFIHIERGTFDSKNKKNLYIY